MTRWILEVNAATTVVVVDLSRLVRHGIRPVLQFALSNTRECGIELFFGNQKRVVLRGECFRALHEVETHAIVSLHDEEMSERFGRREREDICEELRRRRRIRRVNDGVVELYGHAQFCAAMASVWQALTTETLGERPHRGGLRRRASANGCRYLWT